MNKHWHINVIVFCSICVLKCMITKGEVLADQRLKLNNIVTIQNALKKTDNNTIIRRTAFRRLLSLTEGKTLVYQYMNDPDPLIRQAAVYFLHNIHNPKADEYLIKATEDKKFAVKYLAIILLRSRKSVKIKKMLNEIAKTDPDPRIRRIANTKTLFSKRRSMLLRDDPNWDFDIIKLKTLKLSNKGYKFKVDPVADGQTKGFQDMKFDDSAWKTIKPGPWQKHGFVKYKGIVWYRIEFDMPEKIKSNAVELFIPEIDQDAWVWLNGIFIGEHNGEIAKSRAIRLDITNEVKWKKKNMLCIRVSSSSDASGVLAVPCVDILK